MYSSDTARASLLAALMLLVLWPAAQAQSLSPTLGTSTEKAASRTSDAAIGGQIVLLDQTDDRGTGFHSQFNASPANTRSDVTQADDFVVPNGLTWTIERIVQRGFYLGGATTGACERANVTIWTDNGTGAPVAQLFNFDDIAPDSDTAVAGGIGSLVFDITPTTLTSGTYWFSTVCEGAALDYDAFSGIGGRFLVQFNDNGGLGSPHVVRNLANIYGDGSGWVPTTVFFGTRFDMSFGFIGTQTGTALLPELTVTPNALMATSPPDATTTRVLTLRNTGTDVLTYSIPEFAPPPPPTATMPGIRFAGYPSLDAPRPGGSVFNRTGMDTFGYVFKDNDEADGPAFNFTDISGTGTALGLGDDAGTVVPLPFSFEFYGVPHSDVGVASNGYLTFGADLSDFSNDNIPLPGTDPNDFIAPFWDDLNPADADSDDIYVQNMGDGRFIVQWEVVAFSGLPGEELSFQVVLFQDGSFEFHYRDMNDPLETATIGIESPDGTDGVAVSFNEPGYATAGRAIRFFRDLSAADFLTNAQPTSGTLSPGASANVTVTFDASGLAVGTYNDALDIVSNAGNVSVPATLEVVGPPEIFVDPLVLEATLESGDSETRPVTITNTGLEDLEYSFVGYSNSTSIAPANYGQRSAIDLSKGAETASRGTQSFGAGGPDGSGYFWVDSDEPGGPDVDFQDISGSGTEITDTDWTATGTFDPADEGFFEVTLPFTFPYYGEAQTSITVNTNGFAAFDDITANQFTNQAIPVADPPNGILAPFWDDLNLVTSGSVFYGSTPDGRFAIQFNEVQQFGAANDGILNTFQIILGDDGSIEYQYGDMNATTVDSNTIGIESPNGDDGLQIAFNETYIQSDFAILIGREAPLVSAVSPASGTVAPGASTTVLVTLDASERFAGTYSDDLIILSNDPVRPTTTVNVQVTVTGNPAVTVAPSTVGFGEVTLGSSDTETITVTNTGTDVLTINGITSNNAVFTAGTAAETSLVPGASTTFTVRFRPAQLASYSGTITVSTNAGSATVSVAGVASPAPVFSVTPESLDFAITAGETASQSLTLQNDGAGVGTFSATAFSVGDVTSGPATVATEARDSDSYTVPSVTVPRGESSGTRTLHRQAEVTLTHSESQEIVVGNAVACPTAPNSFFRVFDLADFDISGGLDVTSVEYGIEGVQTAAPGSEVILYTLSGDFVRANLTEVARVASPLAVSTAPELRSVDISGAFGEEDVLVVEVTVPTGFMLPGSNAAGQSSPSYVQATACGTDEPTSFESEGFPDLHWVMNVVGESGGGQSADFVTVTPATGSVQPASNRELVVTVDASDLAPGEYDVVVDIATNDPMNPTLSVPVTILVGSGVANEDGLVPTEFALETSAPNPSVGQTSLRYAVPETSDVLIEVYDLMGRRVATLVDGEQTAGRKTVQWNANSLAGGVYVYRMTAGSFASTMKMVVVR